MRSSLYIVLLYLISMSCVSAPNDNLSKTAWIHQPARTIDAGYIVYVASALDRSFEQAKFKAKGAAIEDIANECSFPPKGVRVEDEFETTTGVLNEAYVKMTVPFQDCEEAQKAIDPTSITQLANVSLATLLKRYQDKIDHETDSPDEEQQQQLVKNDEQSTSSTDSTAAQSRQVMYLVQRQQVAYAKEVVILAGSGAYPPGSVQSVQFIQSIHPVMTQIQNYKISNPQLNNSAISWSSLAVRPSVRAISGIHGMRTSKAYAPDNFSRMNNRVFNHKFRTHDSHGSPQRIRFRKEGRRLRR